MLKLLTVQNYQAWRYGEIEFAPGVNIIMGSSDNGKSALLRSVIWLAENRPLGDAPKNWFADESEPIMVSIATDDGVVAAKEKTERVTYYLDNKGKASEYKAVKTEVPKEITEALNISTEFNLQKQHQAHFLLSKTSGEVSRMLNTLVHFDVIDRLYKNLDTRITKSKTGAERSKKEITELTEQIKTFNYIEAADKDIKDIEKDIEKLNNLDDQIETINTLTNNYLIADNYIKHQAPLLDAKKVVESLLLQCKEVESLDKDIKKLTQIQEAISSLSENIIAEKEWLEVKVPYEEITKDIQEHKKLSADIDKLTKWVAAYKGIQEQINKGKGIIEKAKSLYKKELLAASICPTCFQPLSSEKIEQMF